MQRKLPLVTKSPPADLRARSLQDLKDSILQLLSPYIFPTENHHSTEQHFQQSKTGHASKQQEINLESSE